MVMSGCTTIGLGNQREAHKEACSVPGMHQKSNARIDPFEVAKGWIASRNKATDEVHATMLAWKSPQVVRVWWHKTHWLALITDGPNASEGKGVLLTLASGDDQLVLKDVALVQATKLWPQI